MAQYISDLTGCTVTNFVMSPTPAGALLDSATGSFSWTPADGTTPITTRALIDEGSTFTAYSMFDGSIFDPPQNFSDPKLTSPKGFHNDYKVDEDLDFWIIVHFAKDLLVHKFTLMKCGDGYPLDRLINTVQLKYLVSGSRLDYASGNELATN